MKKILCTLMITMMLFMFCDTVNASTPNEDLYNYVSKVYTLGGEDYKLKEENLMAIKRYLSENEISRENADEIIKKVDEVAAVLNAYNTADPTKLPKEKKEEILAIVKEAAILAGASVSWDNTAETLTIYDGNGKKVDVVVLRKYVDENGHKILAPTGNNYGMIITIISSLLIIAFACYLFRKNKLCKAN